jgi:hypothetical protein
MLILAELASGRELSAWDIANITKSPCGDRRLRELRETWDIQHRWHKSEDGARFMRHFLPRKEQLNARKIIKQLEASCK